MGYKAAETTLNINKTFSLWTANEHTVQCGSRSFAKDIRVQDEKYSGQTLEVDKNELRAIIKADPLTTTQQIAEELNVNHSTVIWHLKQIGKVKKLDYWVSHELTTNQENHHFEVLSSLILHNNKEPLIRLWHVTKSGFYTATGNDQLSGWTKKKLQSTSQCLYILIYKGRGGAVVRQKASDSYIAGIQ